MQSVSSRIWTRVAVSISYDDSHYTTGTSPMVYMRSESILSGVELVWIQSFSSLRRVAALTIKSPVCWEEESLICFSYRSLKVKLATLVDGDSKARFSISTSPRCRGGPNSVPGLLNFTLDPYLIVLSVKQDGTKYHFWVFGMTRPGIEPRSPGPLVNILLIRPVND